MKNPLNYQMTEYDCGPTTMMNALSFLFPREQIPPELMRGVMQYTMDGYNRRGEPCKSGTSDMAMRFIAEWLNHYAAVRRFPLRALNLQGAAVRLETNSRVTECLQQRGVAVAKVMLGVWHYVLLTGLDGDCVELFDPYYRHKPYRFEGVEMVWDKPKRCNRRVRQSLLNAEDKGIYAFGKVDCRECVLLFNTKTRLTMETIEYII